MKVIYTLILVVFTLCAFGQDSVMVRNLESEMKKLNTETVFIAQSLQIEEYPLWSPGSDFVACNVGGKWYKFNLANVNLTDGKWHGQTIAVLKGGYSLLSEDEKNKFQKVSKFNSREVITKDGTKIELKEVEFLAVSLIITRKGENPKTLWTTAGENCHTLVLSPDEKYVAYLCELNGLLVMKLK